MAGCGASTPRVPEPDPTLPSVICPAVCKAGCPKLPALAARASLDDSGELLILDAKVLAECDARRGSCVACLEAAARTNSINLIWAD